MTLVRGIAPVRSNREAWTLGSSANSLPPAARKENMELRGIVPAIVPAPPPEPFAVQVIIVDWLYREVDSLAEIKMPVLQHIAGHRNREVYEYLELTHDVRDSRAAAIYSA